MMVTHSAKVNIRLIKDMLFKINNTKESISYLGDLFFKFTSKGAHTDLVNNWEHLFKIVGPTQKLYFIYLVDHIIHRQNEYSVILKNEFKKILLKAFGLAFKLTTDHFMKRKLIVILKLWRKKNTFDSSYIDEILKSPFINEEDILAVDNDGFEILKIDTEFQDKLNEILYIMRLFIRWKGRYETYLNNDSSNDKNETKEAKEIDYKKRLRQQVSDYGEKLNSLAKELSEKQEILLEKNLIASEKLQKMISDINEMKNKFNIK